MLSGFSFVRNATKLYYPVKQSILSVLNLVDEFVIALGDCDPDDRTREEIESIRSPKIRILETNWDLDKFPDGTEHAHQTDIAKQHCKGDWLFYIQSDEAVHEKYHDLPLYLLPLWEEGFRITSLLWWIFRRRLARGNRISLPFLQRRRHPLQR